jgi:hypothetical protein
MENLEELAEKARKKELHRKSMIWTGAMISVAALSAGWIGFGPAKLVPRFGGKQEVPVQLRPSLARWGEFSVSKDKPTLLLMTASWSKQCAETDGTTFADPDVAKMLAEEFHAVRADADERPDLALRYLTRYPTVAVLLPSGQILDAGAYAYHPKAFMQWARTLAAKAQEKRAAVEEAAAKALAAAGEEKPWREPGRRELLARLQKDWGGFPRFDRLEALRSIGAAPALPSALEDPAGGWYRDDSRQEKRLADQAAALEYLTKWGDPARTKAFVETLREKNGYAAGPGDARIFCDENGRLGAVDACLKARKNGLVPRRLGGKVYGLLGDQLGVIEGLLAAGRKPEAKALAAAVEQALLDAKGEAFYDRPARGEMLPALDRLRVPALNLRALKSWKALGSPRAPALEAWLKRHAEALSPSDLAALAGLDKK